MIRGAPEGVTLEKRFVATDEPRPGAAWQRHFETAGLRDRVHGCLPAAGGTVDYVWPGRR